MGKSKKKKLKSNECRVIRIDQEAIYEKLSEDMIDNDKVYFESPASNFHYHCMMDEETGDFICFVSNKFMNDEGYKAVLEKVPTPTTDTLYRDNRFVSIFWDKEEEKKIYSALKEEDII